MYKVSWSLLCIACEFHADYIYDQLEISKMLTLEMFNYTFCTQKSNACTKVSITIRHWGFTRLEELIYT